VAPAVVSRRLDALEARLGVKLLLRTTRRVTLTFEGSAYLEDCQRILRELGEAEASVSLGGVKARGHLRISAPAGFGRRHVAPLIMRFLDANPEVTVNLDLSDRLVDLVNEGIDCAIRVGELTDSSLVSIRLAENRRAVVASPTYLVQHGTPRTLIDLARHNCLSLGQQRGWLFRQGEDIVSIKVNGLLECNDGAVLREWALAGRGLAWRSMWEVGEDLRHGALVPVLEDFAAPPTGIYAVFPQRKYLPLRVRLLIDHLKHSYGNPDYWGAALDG
jgi:DNA-binding transcriptional LysR family regulator